MEVKINVDETQFDEVLKNELRALKPEEIHGVLIDCIGEYFRRNHYEVIEKLIVHKDDWGRTTATDFVTKAIQDCDYSALQDVVDKLIEEMQANHKDILKQVLLDAMVGGLTNTYNFQQTLGNAITHAICEYDRDKIKGYR